jgi:hypothetical protein
VRKQVDGFVRNAARLWVLQVPSLAQFQEDQLREDRLQNRLLRLTSAEFSPVSIRCLHPLSTPA